MALVDGVEHLLGHRLGRPVKDDLAAPDADDPVGIGQGQLHMVDVQQDGDVHILVDPDEILHHLLGGHRVQCGHRLIRQDDLGVLGQGSGQGHPLLLAAGQLIRPDIGLIQNAHLIQALQGQDLILLAKRPQQHPPKGHIRHPGHEHVFDHRGPGHQVEGLEDHADIPAETPQGLSLQIGNVMVVHGKGAAGDVVHPVDGAQQGGFPRAGKADDGHKFPLGHLQAHVVQAHGAVGVYF